MGYVYSLLCPNGTVLSCLEWRVVNIMGPVSQRFAMNAGFLNTRFAIELPLIPVVQLIVTHCETGPWWIDISEFNLYQRWILRRTHPKKRSPASQQCTERNGRTTRRYPSGFAPRRWPSPLGRSRRCRLEGTWEGRVTWGFWWSPLAWHRLPDRKLVPFLSGEKTEETQEWETFLFTISTIVSFEHILSLVLYHQNAAPKVSWRWHFVQ